MGSITGSGRSPGEGSGKPLQYSCKKHPMDRGASWATVHGVTKSDMTEQLSTAQHKSQTANVQWAVSQSNEGNALRKDFPFHTPLLVWGPAEATSQDMLSSTLVAVPQTCANVEPW